jgi:hypothetical protein
MVLGIALFSFAVAAASEADLPLPPLPPVLGSALSEAGALSEDSTPPEGVILTEAVVVEPVADAEPLSQRPQDKQQAQEEQKKRQEKREQQEQQKQKDKDAASKACGEQSKDCKEALKTLRDDGIESIALDIRVGGRPGSDYPCECRLEGETFQTRRFATTMMTWKAAGNCHKPLYFEDWNLERYGHSHGPLDPVFSAAHFFVTLPVLPYKMGVELPWECVYPLGYYRPGSCAPWTVPAVPISCRGFAVEAATVTGLVFLLP